MSRQRRSLLHVFQIPLAISVVSFGGLVLALLMDSRTELVAVLAVGCPFAAIGWSLWRR